MNLAIQLVLFGLVTFVFGFGYTYYDVVILVLHKKSSGTSSTSDTSGEWEQLKENATQRPVRWDVDVDFVIRTSCVRRFRYTINS